jgi:hypothetical protein
MKIRELAKRDGISINQFIATAVAEKAAALDRVLTRVPDRDPVPGDELPGQMRPRSRAGRKARVRAPGSHR